MGLFLWAAGALVVVLWLGTWVLQIALVLGLVALRLLGWANLIIVGTAVALVQLARRAALRQPLARQSEAFGRKVRAPTGMPRP